MLTFTLDTNCIIDVEEDRPAAEEIWRLVEAHKAGLIDVAVVAMMASERSPASVNEQVGYHEFARRLHAVGLEALTVCLPIGQWDITYWDACDYGCDADEVAMSRLWKILFPQIDEKPGEEPCGAWRNANCDVQTLYSHIRAKRDVFVTRDRNFIKPSKIDALIDEGVGIVERPSDAVKRIVGAGTA